MTTESVLIESSLLSHYSLQLNRWFLTPIGAWPPSSSTSRLERILSIVLMVVCLCSISFTVIPCILHLMLEDEDVRVKLKVLGPLSHWFTGGINYAILLLRSGQIRHCVDHVEADWAIVTKEKHRDIMLSYAKLGRYVAIFCAAFMQGGVFSYTIATATEKHVIVVDNETRSLHLLPCPPYRKLLNSDTSPMNEIVLASQFLSCFIVNSGTVCVYSLAAVLASHACGQLNVLTAWITEFVNKSGKGNKSVWYIEMKMIVEHHLRILSFISNIEDVMNRICFMELFKATLDICMLSYYILTEWADHDVKTLSTYVVIFISMSFNIFIMCYIGEVLAEQCKKVGEMVYMTEWYYLPHKKLRDLNFILARSAVVVKITAGKFIPMSISTFSDVMKTSFAYLNLLRQTT